MTAPILFALVLGAIEFSRANMLVHTASIAATEAARRSIIPGATASEVRLKALDELSHVGILDATVDVQPADIIDDTTQVTVNLTVPVTMRNGYGLSRIFMGKQIFKSVTLQREGKTESVGTETIRYNGMQVAPPVSNNAASNNAANGNAGSGNAASGNSGSNSGSSNSGGGSGSGNSGGFLGALRRMLGL